MKLKPILGVIGCLFLLMPTNSSRVLELRFGCQFSITNAPTFIGIHRMRSTHQQLVKMLDHMSKSQYFANGEYTGPMGKGIYLQEWELLQKILNDAGPAKTVEQWRNIPNKIHNYNNKSGQRQQRVLCVSTDEVATSSTNTADDSDDYEMDTSNTKNASSSGFHVGN